MKSVLLDTNLLLLYIVGNIDPSKVGRQRRLKQFDLDNLENLNRIVKEFTKHVSLPNVLTETSNFIGSGNQEIAKDAVLYFANYCRKIDEVYYESRNAVDCASYSRLGLTDAAVLKVGKDGVTVITDDHALAGYLLQAGVEVVNIHHYYKL